MTAPTGRCQQCCSPRCAGPGLTHNPDTGQYEVCVAPDGGLEVDAAGCLRAVGGSTDCGCDGTETRVVAGDRVTVTGTGSTADPYTVSVDPADLISPAPTQLIEVAADGGLLLDCDAVNSCVTPPDGSETIVTAGTGITVTGTGTLAAPYVVNADPTELLSADVGNILGLGSDGLLDLDCDAVADCVVVTAGPGATVTGAGTAADPYIVGAPGGAPDGSETIVEAGTGITVTGNGTVATPYVVNAIPPTGAETVVTAGTGATVTGTGTAADPYVVSSTAAAPTVGCGLSGTGSGADPLAVAASGTWGTGPLTFPCDDTNGQAIYCDTAGDLRTAPEKFTTREAAFQAGIGTVAPGATGTTLEMNDLTISITNPSPCRPMRADFIMSVSNVEMTQSPGSDWRVDWGFTSTTDGSAPPLPAVTPITLYANRHSPNATFGTHTNFPPVGFTLTVEELTGAAMIPPGGTVSVRVRVQAIFDETNPATIPGDFPPAIGNAGIRLALFGWNEG